LSVILPLLIVIFIVFQYVLPYLYTEQIERLRHAFSYGLLIICLITVLGFFLLLVWIKSIENLTVEAQSKFAGVLPEKPELKEENEVEILQKLFADVHSELQEKVDQINAYSQKLLESNIKLSELSITDDLTTLYNRRYFDLRLREEVRRQQRYKHNTALIMVDVDGFKQYNDLNGHPAGDELLKDLGQLIRNYIRKSDIPARYGGDEFAIICPERDTHEANLIAERLAQAFAARRFSYLSEKSTETATISYGIAINGQTPEEFVTQADKGLYKAKNSSKDG
jgi:diguanylate cyclase (GGDEF)-like protein